MSTENTWEQQARDAKVRALAAWLTKTMRRMPDLTEAEAADAACRFMDRANDAAWEMAAREAGCNVPSQQTKDQLRRFLEVERDTLAPADAFAGIPDL